MFPLHTVRVPSARCDFFVEEFPRFSKVSSLLRSLPRNPPPFLSPSNRFLPVQREQSQWYAAFERRHERHGQSASVNAWKIGRQTVRFSSSSLSTISTAVLLRPVNGSICAYFFRPLDGKIDHSGVQKEWRERLGGRGIIAFRNNVVPVGLSKRQLTFVADIVRALSRDYWIFGIVILNVVLAHRQTEVED